MTCLDRIFSTMVSQAMLTSVLEWIRDGSVNVNLSGWWFETDVGKIVLREYDAYRHHL